MTAPAIVPVEVEDLAWLLELGEDLPRAAAHYAEHGAAIFPLGGKDGKEPLISRGHHAASCDPEQVAWWWRRWPAANIGVPVSGGHVVIDIDPRHAGDLTIAAHARQRRELPATLAAETGGGGSHLWFAIPEGIEARQGAGVLGPGVDTRAAGRGYIVAAPSIHGVTGRRYRWRDAIAPAMAPAWLVEILSRPGHASEAMRQPYAPPSTRAGRTRRERYALAVLRGEALAVAEAREGTRNYRLDRAWRACANFRDVLDRSQVERELTAAALAAGLEAIEIAKVLR